MSIKNACSKYQGWRFNVNGDASVLDIPQHSISFSFQRLTRNLYVCKVDSKDVFAEIIKSFSVDTKNCPPLTFRTDVRFIESGEFFEWLDKRLTAVATQKSDAELLAEIEVLNKQTETERNSITSQRRGQEILRRILLLKEGGKCIISKIANEELLIVSHIKPWADCSNRVNERLDVENVLLLSANWDALFDKKLISFDPETGKMIKSDRIDDQTLLKLGVPSDWRDKVCIPVKTENRKKYLEWHNNLMREKDKSAQNKE